MNSNARASMVLTIVAALLCTPLLLAQDMPGGAPGQARPHWWPEPQPDKRRVGGPPKDREAGPAINWSSRSVSTLRSAASTQTPILICFIEDDLDADGALLAEFTDKLIPVRVDRGATPTELATEPQVADPQLADPWKLARPFLATNVTKAYGVDAGKNCFVLCDWHGNEIGRMSSLSHRTLEGLLDRVPAHVTRQRARLAGLNTTASSLLAQGDRRAAIGQWLRALREGCWGHPEATEAENMLQKLLRDGLRELHAAENAGDLAAVERLKRDFKGSRLTDRITRLLAKMHSPEQEESF